MKVLIADDEKPARDRLSRMVSKLSGYQVVGEAKTGREAIELVESTGADIVLMDIRMPEMDGLQAAKHICHLAQPPALIFTTAYADHALEAFETHAVDYLLKPVRSERLQVALQASARPNRAQVSQTNEILDDIEPRQHICARVRGNLVLVPVEHIYYFLADQKYVTVRHKDGEVLIEAALKNLEHEFGDHFYRIHRNALINTAYLGGMIVENDNHQVSFQGIDDKLDVSRRHLSGVRKIIKNL